MNEINKVSITDQMAQALANDSGENVSDIAERVAEKENTREQTLLMLLSQAAEAKSLLAASTAPSFNETSPKKPGSTKTPKVSSTPAVDGRQRRNYDVVTRQIHIFSSATLNAAFISSNLLYDNKDSAKQVELCRRDLKPQKKPTELMAQVDLVCCTVETDVPYGNELNQLKAWHHDKLVTEGKTLISNRPKFIESDVPTETPDAVVISDVPTTLNAEA